MVEDVAGMVPREDNKIELNPIEIPGWNYFTVNNLALPRSGCLHRMGQGRRHYGGPAGYSLYVGGKLAFTSDKLAHLIYDPAAGTVEVKDDSSAQVTVGAEAVKNVKAANQVTFNADQRVTDLFAKSGTNSRLRLQVHHERGQGRGRDRYHLRREGHQLPGQERGGRQDRDGIVLGYQGL